MNSVAVVVVSETVVSGLASRMPRGTRCKYKNGQTPLRWVHPNESLHNSPNALVLCCVFCPRRATVQAVAGSEFINTVEVSVYAYGPSINLGG